MSIRAVAAAIVAAAVVAPVITVATAGAAGAGVSCRAHTRSVAHESSAKAIATVAANIPAACGFTVSGSLLGRDFGTDGTPLTSPAAYDGHGDRHVVTASQGTVFDFYKVGKSEYLRTYAYGSRKPGKWRKLTVAQEKNFSLAPLDSTASLAAAIAKGSGKAWKLAGTATVRGVRCTVLTEPRNVVGEFVYPAETMDVDTATGLPVQIHFAGINGISLYATFGHWGRTSVTAPPPSEVTGG